MAVSSRREGEPANVTYWVLLIGFIILFVVCLAVIYWDNIELFVESTLWWLRVGFFLVAFFAIWMVFFCLADRARSDAVLAAIVAGVCIVVGLIMHLLLMLF